MPQFTTVKDVVAVMPKYFLPEAAAGMNATLQLDLTDEGGGVWHLIVADGQLTVNEGPAANPNMTLKMTAADYLAMINGEASAMQMFMKGKVKVGGDMSLAMKLQNLFKMQ
ncbi:MAG TPA: SCP2 sterol-binding domain-containing protein [Anaerolineales bacterium]|nr:SCP2 sterol-binding domain-containing protein [Anaerolineales bacterium]HLF03181.1 SCP2 sterol-binding domain-containing protein [Anaerolineales bacterium]